MRKLPILVLSLIVAAALAVPALGSPSTKHVLVGDDLAFHPHKLKLHRGSKVIWKWQGGLEHNVTVIKGPVKFHSKTMMTGTYSHRFTRKGTYTLECTIHFFTMTVKVT
jgi:plastocyanin